MRLVIIVLRLTGVDFRLLYQSFVYSKSSEERVGQCFKSKSALCQGKIQGDIPKIDLKGFFSPSERTVLPGICS